MSRDTPVTPPPVREVKVEVLPGGAHSPRGSGLNDPLAELIARVMDSLFTIPGTKIRMGLDPILGLLPLVGSPASAMISVLMLARSARQGVPNFILARMALNVVLNAILDEIPVVGDFLSIFFRSNKINFELMEKYAGTRKAYSTLDRLFIVSLIGGVVLFFVFAIVLLASLFLALWHWLFR